jgi:hypothetical protein
MRAHRTGRVAPRLLVAVAVIAALVSCRSDAPVAPPEEQVTICHLPSSTASLTDVPMSEVATHISQGDYVARLVVDPKTTLAGDGVHFTRIMSALAAARTGRLQRAEKIAASCRITIAVAAGNYRGAIHPTTDTTLEQFPLVVDVPLVSLTGALKMQLDAKGRATGASTALLESTLTPATGMAQDVDAIIIVNGHPDGSSAGNGAVIEGFAFRSGHVGVDSDSGGFGVFTMRVKDVVIRGNRFEPALTSAIDLRATSGVVTQNHIAGAGAACDICIAGPGSFNVNGNRVLASGIDGIVLNPTVVIPVPSA